MPFQTQAFSPSIKYMAAALIYLRRFINRSVANMLEARERAAMRAGEVRRTGSAARQGLLFDGSPFARARGGENGSAGRR